MNRRGELAASQFAVLHASETCTAHNAQFLSTRPGFCSVDIRNQILSRRPVTMDTCVLSIYGMWLPVYCGSKITCIPCFCSATDNQAGATAPTHKNRHTHAIAIGVGKACRVEGHGWSRRDGVVCCGRHSPRSSTDTYDSLLFQVSYDTECVAVCELLAHWSLHA